MGELLNITGFTTKTLDARSYEPPSRLQITSRTVASLENNIANFLDKVVDRWNQTYSKLVNAVEISEKIKAEEAAKNKMLGLAELEATVEQNKTISKITAVEEVNKRLNSLTVELLKLAGRIGTLNNNYGINVKPGFAQKPPKAISVKKLCADVFKELMLKIDLYKIALKDGVAITEGKTGENKKPENKKAGGANWKQLFDGSKIPEDLTIVANKEKEEKKEMEEENVAPQPKLNERAIEARVLIANVGDELETIDERLNDPNGVPFQYREGLIQRREKLVKILSDLTGIEPNENKAIEMPQMNTPIQEFIDRNVGYKEAPTEEEHKIEERRQEEYYSQVSDIIDRLQEKDHIYIFNEGMEKVFEAEKIDDQRKANERVKESNEEIEALKEEKMRTNYSAEEEAIKMLEGYVDMKDREIIILADRAARQFAAANTAADMYETNEVLDMADVAATQLAAANTAADIYESNVIIDLADKAATTFAANNEALRFDELNKIADAAHEAVISLLAEDAAFEIEVHNELLKIADETAISFAAENEAIRLNDINKISEAAFDAAIELLAADAADEINENNKMAQAASLYAIIRASEAKMKDLEEQKEQIDLSLDAIRQEISEYKQKAMEEKQTKEVVVPKTMTQEEIVNSANTAAEELYARNSTIAEITPQVVVETQTQPTPEPVVEQPKQKKKIINIVQVQDRFAEQFADSKKLLARKSSVDEMRKKGAPVKAETKSYADTNKGVLADLEQYLSGIQKPVLSKAA